MYTVDDARRECRELIKEGYSFSAIRIFLNDLARSKDITWDDNTTILMEIANGELLGNIDCSIHTF